MLFKHLSLSEIEKAVLQSVGVRDAEELLSLVDTFPNLGQVGLDLTKLSDFAMQHRGAKFHTATISPTGARKPSPQLAWGAMSPPGVRFPTGYQVLMPAVMSLPDRRRGQLSGPNIDLRLTRWPTRDQGQRGTCVAFAVTACREHIASEAGSAADVALSEQFLYWATKTKTFDPMPDEDGTLIRYACQALAQDGICRRMLWPYQGMLNPSGCIPPNISHENLTNPSLAAKNDAKDWRYATGNYKTGSCEDNAAHILNALVKTRRPVAVSVPVFQDPISAGDNWTTPVGLQYGRVLDPPPTSLVVGGHAVCITGFITDPAEATGGWFTFRNSWGLSWARLASTPESKAPELGYGYISATYINKYLWEMSY